MMQPPPDMYTNPALMQEIRNQVSTVDNKIEKVLGVVKQHTAENKESISDLAS